jgi:serine/threonine protein kinase
MSDPDHAELESVTGGRYEIEGFLAQGGMGKVYTGRNRSLGSRVAIKVLPTEVATSDVRLARFKREAALAANLSHPNIVPVFEFDATPGLAYLVMPFVEGQTLAQELAERGQLEVAEVRRLIDDVGKALAFAHKNGVIHRDIKPANLIRETATDRWLVTDFGVAHSARPEETEITQTGVVVGTPAYMPPEQATGIGVDPRTDLYSLAVVAFQALCGLGYDDLADCLTKGRSTLERVLAMAQPRMRSALVKALVWPLEKVPDERPQSAEAWLETLMEAERTQSLYRWAWAAAAASLAIAAFIMFRPAPTTPTPTSPAIAVAPFRGDISGSSGDLSIANLADLFDWQLKYLPNHRVMGASFRGEAESRFGSAPETDALIQLARERGATMLVEGRAGSRGDLLTLEILVYEVASERRVASADTVGPADSLDALVSALVITAFAERDAQQLSGWKRALPKGLEATTAFLQGNLDLRRGSYRNAADQYNEVIRRDSTFAPAHFNRMFALMFGGRPSEYSVHVSRRAT